MKRFDVLFQVLITIALITGGVAAAGNPGSPSVRGKQALATVNGEPVTLPEFRKSLASLHMGVEEKETSHRRNYSGLLQRLINAKLIFQEARNIGLDEIPEVQEPLREYREQALRGLLIPSQIKGVRPDDREVDKLYRKAIQEVKIHSYLFDKEEDARQATEEIGSGSHFDNVMNRFISEGKAKGEVEGVFLKKKDLAPEISDAVSKMKDGDVSPPLKVVAGKKPENAFAILRLEGVRFPENAGEKEKARKEILQKSRIEAITKFGEGLKKKYTKILTKTLESLDFESKEPGLGKLLEDRRIVAKIQGEKPILVKDLSLGIQQKFYHGLEIAAEGKKVNKSKRAVLDEILLKRVLAKEARRKKIDKTVAYKESVDEYRNSLLFGMFVQKVIDQDIRLDDAILRKYFEEHPEEFISRKKIRLDDLAFGDRENAADALEKLRRGADLKWVKVNAPGQIEEKSRQRISPLGGELYEVNDLPDEIEAIVSDARAGEFRLYASPEGQYFVLRILDVIPETPYPFDQAKGSIAKIFMETERKKSFEGWIEKLRAASEIRILATEEELGRMVARSGGGAAKP